MLVSEVSGCSFTGLEGVPEAKSRSRPGPGEGPSEGPSKEPEEIGGLLQPRHIGWFPELLLVGFEEGFGDGALIDGASTPAGSDERAARRRRRRGVLCELPALAWELDNDGLR